MSAVGLADIVLGLAKNGVPDPKQIADAAVQMMLTGPLGVRSRSGNPRH
jgi:hypothetical protein